eukprot:6017964-Ditylum_brightwellii.AAC.1
MIINNGPPCSVSAKQKNISDIISISEKDQSDDDNSWEGCSSTMEVQENDINKKAPLLYTDAASIGEEDG